MKSLGSADADDVNVRQILDGSLAFIGLLDHDGTLLEANALALQAGGLTRDDVIGKKFWDCYWWSYDETVRSQVQDAQARALMGEIVRYDVRVRMAGGHLMWIDFQLIPLKNKDGQITHTIPSGLDLTSRKVAEADLRTSEEKFRGVFENAYVGVALVGLEGKWLEVNDRLCELLGYTREELLTRTFQDITHPDDLQSDLGFVDQLLSGEFKNYKMDKRYLHRTGRVVWANLTVALQCGHDGAPLYFISIVNDITDRVKAQQHQQILMAELAHRLKNQLGIVQAISSQSAKGAQSLGEFQDKFAGRLNALAMSADLLVYQQRVSVALNELVHQTLKPFTPRVMISGPHIMIPGEAAEILALALHELATNCTKYGAWSAPDGVVALNWKIEHNAPAMIQLQWIERDGPPVKMPARTGFGQKIIEDITAQKLKAKVVLSYEPAGLQWHIRMPLDAAAQL